MSFFKYIFILIVFGQIFTLSGQTWRERWESYRKGLFVPTDSLIFEEAANENPYYLTLLALSYSSGDKAVELYEKIYKMQLQPELRKFVADKLADYYYARGLYLTAAKYRKNAPVLPHEITEKKEVPGNPTSQYFLQFAVFSTRRNAVKFIEKQKSEKIDLKMIEKNSKFYVVNGPYGTREEAEIFKRAIRERSNKLKPFIKLFMGE